MYVSQKGQYTLRALFELAKRQGSTAATAAEIAQSQAIPPRFLELILQGLRAKGIVDSRRGNQGGYVLTVAPESISVGDIIRIVDGSLAPVECVEGRTGEHCRLRGRCAFMGLWQKAHDAIQQVYDGTSLQDLIDGEQPALEEQGVQLEYAV
jgi:Rrf2 family transcriptional regulator, cysteine metabolism repressor